MSYLCAYCKREEKSWTSIPSYRCEECGAYVHFDCIKSKQPSPLLGNTFFKFKCQSCGEDNEEDFQRVNLSWRNAVMLALYNLHKTGHGKCGFFHWKAHICAFIDTNWLALFGHERKKTGLWMGTIAGALSSGCPEVFESGMNVVEQGYWRLITVEPPLMMAEKKAPKPPRKRQSNLPSLDFNCDDRSRRRKASSLTAAIELREQRENYTKSAKRSARNTKGSTQTKKEKGKKSQTSSKNLPETEDSLSSAGSFIQEDVIIKEEECSIVEENLESQNNADDVDSLFSASTLTNEQAKPQVSSSNITYSSLGLSLGDGEDSDWDLDMDVDIESVAVNLDHAVDIRSMSPELDTLIPLEDIKWEQGSMPEMESLPSDDESEGQSEREIKEEVEDKPESEAGDDNDDGNETESTEDGYEDEENDEGADTMYPDDEKEKEKNENEQSVRVKKKKQGRPRKRRRLDDPPPVASPERLQRISVFEETELLNKLNSLADNQTLTPELTVLRRKLICNQTNREYGLPVFDLDAQVKKAMKTTNPDPETEMQKNCIPLLPKLPMKTGHSKETRDLDRFMMKDRGKRKEMRTYTSFRQRLVGFEDNELKPVRSPYTNRTCTAYRKS